MLEDSNAIGHRALNPFSPYKYLTLIGMLETGKRIQQRCFSAARRTQKADELTALDFQRHMTQRMERLAFSLVYLRHIVNLNVCHLFFSCLRTSAPYTVYGFLELLDDPVQQHAQNADSNDGSQ